MPSLNQEEITALVNLTDQFGGWTDVKATSFNEKAQFISRQCGASLPNFLLSVLSSEHFQKKYREEFNKLTFLSTADKRIVILALYLSNIGEDVPSYMLSDAFKVDAGALADRLSSQPDGLKLTHRSGNMLRAIPAVGSRNVLQHMLSDGDIVDSIVSLLMYLDTSGK